MARGLLQHVEGADDVDLDHTTEIIGAELSDRAGGHVDAGIGHHAVRGAAEILGDRLKDSRDLGSVGDVHRVALGARGTDARRHVGGTRDIGVGDIVAALGELAHARGTDAAGAAKNEGDGVAHGLSFEVEIGMK
jgi:hypothetical protein